MPSSNFEALRAAIQNRQQVIGTYKGRHREMCPHAIGYKEGREKVLLFQFAGDSSKGRITSDTADNWRCMFVDELVGMRVKDGEWHTFGNHSRPSTCFDRIVLEVPH